MKNSSRIVQRLALAGVMVVAAVALVWWARSDAPPSPAAPAQAAHSPAASAPAAPDLRASLGQPPAGIDPPAMPPDMIARVLKKDEKLARFMDYHKTVLLSAERRDEYRKLLSDPAMMAAMADGLMAPGSGEVNPEEYYRKLMQIDYFEAALTWKENPQRDRVVDLTGEIIAKDNFATGQNTARRQMLGGTKMELYRLLHEQDAARTEQLVAAAKGTRMETLVAWMAQEELRRRTREEEIHKEVQEMQEKEQAH